MSSALTFVLDGWPRDLSDYSSDVTPYKNRESELSVKNGCIFWSSKIVIPPRCKNAVLTELHEGQFGASKMKSRSRAKFWWPG